MSDAKFASITSALLARKGEAAPSLVMPAARHVPPPETRAPVRRPVERREDASPAGDRKRRVVVTLSGEEYVRLGIIAAKKNSTRHDMVRDVLFAELDAFARTEAPDCRCINSGEPCDCAAESDHRAESGDDAVDVAAAFEIA
jgi:hypothetical protein